MIVSVRTRLCSLATLVGLVVLAASLADAATLEPILPIPPRIAYNLAKAQLGRTLFEDSVLSQDRSVSCASCHDLAHGGHNAQPVSTGVKGRQGVMNAPTVFNAVFNFRQCWNGRDHTLQEQATGPLTNPVEMEMTAAEVEERLNADAAYRRAFYAVYGKRDITYDDVLDAIAEFEKALITPDCRFDRYLRGEIELNDAESKGYLTFKELGCVTCHNGVNIGGNSFQKMGVLNPFSWDDRNSDRFKETGNACDKNVYKVPTLRNIECTAPYFHDGSKKTLPESIAAMAFHNLGLELTDQEVRPLIAFLKSLTGRQPEILAGAGGQSAPMVAPSVPGE